jgi:chromosome segregation ATPase
VERSEKATLERQLGDALLAVELTHAEASKESSQLVALRQELATKDGTIETVRNEAVTAAAEAERLRNDLKQHTEYSTLLEQSLAAIQDAMAEAETKMSRLQDENKELLEEAERSKSLAEAATAHLRGTMAAQQEAMQSAVDTAVLEATDRVSEVKSREIAQLERETNELRRIVALLEDENRFGWL